MGYLDANKDVRGVILTPQLEDAMDGIIHAHRTPGLQVVLAPPGVGKTTMAMVLADRINDDKYAKLPKGCRAVYFEVGGDSGRRGMKAGIYRLHALVLGELTEYALRSRLPERLSTDVVLCCRRKGIQFVLVDEAGTTSEEELRGFVHVWDRAKELGWPLTIVLIGMEKPLKAKIVAQEQVDSRVMRWTRLGPWTADNMWKLLVNLCPLIPAPDKADEEARAVVSFLYDKYAGVPRHVLPFVDEVERRMAQRKEITLTLKLAKFVWHFLQHGRNGDDDCEVAA